MALPRKDIKVHFDAEMHAAIVAIAQSKGLELGKFVESLVVPHIVRGEAPLTALKDHANGTN